MAQCRLGFLRPAKQEPPENGVFHSVVDLHTAINRFIKEHNRDPRPFAWKAANDQIIAVVRRGHQALESIHSRLGDTSKPFAWPDHLIISTVHFLILRRAYRSCAPVTATVWAAQ